MQKSMSHTKSISNYEITNSKHDADAVDVRIYGIIPSWDWEAGTANTAKSFTADLKRLEGKYKRVNIHINSPGGSLQEGFAMFNAIANSKADVHTYNDGIAFSLGGLLLMAGHTVHASRNSLILIHNTQGYAEGDANDLRQMAEIMDKFDIVIANILSKKSGKDLKLVRQEWLNYRDTVITAEEALELGLIDVIEDTKADISAPIKNLYNLAHHTPKNLLTSNTNQKSMEGNVDEKGLFAVLRNFFSASAPTPPAAPPAPQALPISESQEYKALMAKMEAVIGTVESVKAELEENKKALAESKTAFEALAKSPAAQHTKPLRGGESDPEPKNSWDDDDALFNKMVDNGRLMNATKTLDLRIKR